ncbi:MAG: TAXI family TRAP transporter solute-binding subunit [Thermodesulfobacteriota bacterium]
MNNRKILFLSLLLGAAWAVFSVPFSHAAGELIPLYSPPVGGTAYVLGAGVVTVTNKYIPDAHLVHEASTGTLDMVRRMMQRDGANQPAFAIFGCPDAWKAYKGMDPFAGKAFTNLRAIVFVNASDQYLVVPAKSPIKSYGDVKGKRIGIGGPGSTVANSAFLMLEYSGVKKSDFKPYYFTYKETVQGIQDGSLDGGFVGGGYPIAIYTELAMKHDVRIVPMDEKVLQKVIAEHPYYYGTVVKAKSYKGLERDTPIYGFTTALWALSGMSTDFIYKVTKNLFDRKEDYYAIHKSAKDMTLQDAMKGIPLSFHPGAEKFYREAGVLKK